MLCFVLYCAHGRAQHVDHATAGHLTPTPNPNPYSPSTQGDDYSKAAVCQFLVCNKFEFETDNGKVSVKSSAKDELECFMDLKVGHIWTLLGRCRLPHVSEHIGFHTYLKMPPCHTPAFEVWGSMVSRDDMRVREIAWIKQDGTESRPCLTAWNESIPNLPTYAFPCVSSSPSMGIGIAGLPFVQPTDTRAALEDHVCPAAPG